jgi:hypothetical protein
VKILEAGFVGRGPIFPALTWTFTFLMCAAGKFTQLDVLLI